MLYSSWKKAFWLRAELSGGNFTLQGGFWGVVAAVQAPGALPLLRGPERS